MVCGLARYQLRGRRDGVWPKRHVAQHIQRHPRAQPLCPQRRATDFGRPRRGSRSITPPWRSIRFRLAPRTYAPRGCIVRVVNQTKSRKIPTRKMSPLFFAIRVRWEREHQRAAAPPLQPHGSRALRRLSGRRGRRTRLRRDQHRETIPSFPLSFPLSPLLSSSLLFSPCSWIRWLSRRRRPSGWHARM